MFYENSGKRLKEILCSLKNFWVPPTVENSWPSQKFLTTAKILDHDKNSWPRQKFLTTTKILDHDKKQGWKSNFWRKCQLATCCSLSCPSPSSLLPQMSWQEWWPKSLLLFLKWALLTLHWVVSWSVVSWPVVSLKNQATQRMLMSCHRGQPDTTVTKTSFSLPVLTLFIPQFHFRSCDFLSFFPQHYLLETLCVPLITVAISLFPWYSLPG